MRPVIRNGSCTSNAMISAGSRRQRDVTRQDEGPSGKQPHAPLRMARALTGQRPGFARQVK